MGQTRNIVDISTLDNLDAEFVGKKASEFSRLRYLNISIPEGFVIKTSFFEEFLEITGIHKEIQKIKKTYHPSLEDSVERLYEPIRKKIMHTHIPQILALEFNKFYRKLAGVFKEVSVNIFTSSMTYKSIFVSNIKGDANIVLKIKTIWSSNFHNPVTIVITKNIKHEIKGRVFTDRPTIDKRLTEKQMDELINYCKIIQKHFYFPYEIEYFLIKGKIFISKVDPFTGTVNEFPKPIIQNKTRKILVKGISINPGIVTGRVRILHGKYGDIGAKKEEVIVLPNLFPSIFKKMKNAKAVVVDSILSNSLAKTLYRKNFKIPTIEGTKNATKIFHNGNVVTVNGMSGEIYSGGLV